MLPLLCAATPAWRPSAPPSIGRRAALSTAAAAAALLPRSQCSAAEAVTPAKLQASVVALDGLLREWPRLVIDCTFAEVPRELLETKNKEKLLQQASTLALFDKSASINVCKSSNAKVLQVLGKIPNGEKLQSPILADRVEPDDFEAFLAASERYGSALSAAESAAFLSATGDYSARTSFKEGEQASTPNLDASRENVLLARDALLEVLRLLRVEVG